MLKRLHASAQVRFTQCYHGFFVFLLQAPPCFRSALSNSKSASSSKDCLFSLTALDFASNRRVRQLGLDGFLASQQRAETLHVTIPSSLPAEPSVGQTKHESAAARTLDKLAQTTWWPSAPLSFEITPKPR